VAGAVNSIAGGGTLFTFPSLIAAGLSPIAANATSTVSLVPGSGAAMWGYRQEVMKDRRYLLALAAPSLVGGFCGAQLVLASGEALFAKVVPWLILGATVLFALQERITKRIGRGKASLPAVMFFQLIVSVYGGYFGAGMGILILAALGYLGMDDVHAMNGWKNFAAVCINGVATVTFIAYGRVVWPLAGIMAGGAIAGGYLGARLARRVAQQHVRKAIAVIGFGIAVVMLVKQLQRP
jgi:uncharacterized membrane protein YfcA